MRDLFDQPAYPDRAGFKEPTTSRAAADKIEATGRANTLRTRVLDWYAAGNQGTADECAKAIGETILAIRPRVSELNKKGRLTKTGVRRASSAGSSSHVWRAL